MFSQKDICAILVTYYPQEHLEERLKNVLCQVDQAVIIDNYSPEPYAQSLKKTASDFGANLIVNSQNLGIATALNQGLNYARLRGYKWALTLDQDSIVRPHLVEACIDAYRECGYRNLVGLIGSNFREKHTGKTLVKENRFKGKSWAESKMIITSGSLMSIPIFDKVGPFRDDYFIDMVDFEYCMRLRTKGYKVIITSHIGMDHPIGAKGTCKAFNKRLEISSCSPIRNYYRCRNSIIMAREYFWEDPLWALKRAALPAKDLARACCIEDNKTLRLKYIFMGLYHALILKQGELDES